MTAPCPICLVAMRSTELLCIECQRHAIELLRQPIQFLNTPAVPCDTQTKPFYTIDSTETIRTQLGAIVP